MTDTIRKINLGYIKYGMLPCSKLSKDTRNYQTITSYLGTLSGYLGMCLLVVVFTNDLHTYILTYRHKYIHTYI